MDEGDLLAERRRQWQGQGFDGDAITSHLKSLGGNITESVIRVEKAMVHAISLRKTVSRWPTDWSERDEMLEALRNPANLPACQQRWQHIMRRRRPWVLAAQDAELSWSREGRGEELRRWLERLETIDESMTPHAEDVVSNIRDVARREVMESEVVRLEERQLARRQILEDMVAHLRGERGWALTGLQGNLAERYSEVSRIHEMDTTLAQIEEWVDEVITLYDINASRDVLRKAALAQRMEDGARLRVILEGVEQMCADFSARLQAVTGWLADLRHRGLHIEAPTHPQPSDLLALEARVDETNRRVERLNRVWVRLDGLISLFPEHAGIAVALEGQVDRIDQMEELLFLLEQRRDEREGESRARVAAWKAAGFEITGLESLLDNTPRAGWLAVEERTKKVKVCQEILHLMEGIDFSFEGGDERDEWRTLMTAADVSTEDYDLVSEGIARLLRRNRWHREKLDSARLALSAVWPASLNPQTLSLAEYEDVITTLSAGQSLASDHPLHLMTDRENRLLAAALAEIDMWRRDGWDVTSLDDLAERDHLSLWLALPSMRQEVDDHAILMQRLYSLPLARDPKLLADIKRDSARPDRLARLRESYPEIARHIAGCAGGAEAPFTLFTPTPPEVFAKLTPLVPVLVPSVDAEAPSADDGRVEGESSLEKLENGESETHQKVEPQTPHDEMEKESHEAIGLESGLGGATDLQSGEGALHSAAQLQHLSGEKSDAWVIWKEMRDSLGGPLDISPRDLRVQRLVRLADLIEPTDEMEDDSKVVNLVVRMQRLAKTLQGWTGLRLERRNASSEGDLLDTSTRLAQRLEDIPGPGFSLPTNLDTEELPRRGDFGRLAEEIARLERAVYLPAAGGKPNIKAM